MHGHDSDNCLARHSNLTVPFSDNPVSSIDRISPGCINIISSSEHETIHSSMPPMESYDNFTISSSDISSSSFIPNYELDNSISESSSTTTAFHGDLYLHDNSSFNPVAHSVSYDTLNDTIVFPYSMIYSSSSSSITTISYHQDFVNNNVVSIFCQIPSLVLQQSLLTSSSDILGHNMNSMLILVSHSDLSSIYHLVI